MTTTTTTSTTTTLPPWEVPDCPHVTVCPTTCEWIFGRIKVWPTIQFGTVVEWSLHPAFLDAAPHTFQLQIAHTSTPNEADWEDVGDPVVDTFLATDVPQRVYGRFQWTHYRIQLTTGEGTYLSAATNSLGAMGHRDWNKANEIIRQQAVRLKAKAGSEGYLLKRRLHGTPCSECLDTMTGEIRNPQCETCLGTGFEEGYYDPVPCFYVELQEAGFRSHVKDGVGTTDDGVRAAGRMINVPQIFSYDAWVDKVSDHRWIMHSIKSEAEIRGTPIILFPVEMRLAPFTHPIYTIPVP
jgi:hypothetical protein